MIQDLRFAVRMILSHRWFSLAIVATMAMSIGLNTMVFTLVNAALFKPVAVPGGERLLAVRNRNLSKGERSLNLSYPEFREYRAQSSSLEHLEAESRAGAVLSEQGNPPQSYNMDLVSSGTFEMLHMRPVLGRGFLPGDDKPGAEAVLLLGHGVWTDRYGSSPNVVGRVVRVNTKPATIIGVMPEGFKFPDNVDLWMPLVPTVEMESRTRRTLRLFVMRKPGISRSQVEAELQGIAGRIAGQHPDTNKGIEPLVETFHERFNGGPIRSIFLLMLAAVGFVLLVACANIANMMLSRSLARQREISIRAAMGASRWQLIRQLLIESMMLSAVGGLVGLGIAVLGVHGFDLASRDVGKPYWVLFTMDYTVFGYFAGLCILSGLLFGLAPALQASRVDLNSVMKDGTRTAGSRPGGKLSGALVIFQFALTLVLLMGAGVFLRSFLDSQTINSAVPSDQILTARVNLPRERYADAAARVRFFDQLLPRLQALPGVTQVAIASNAPGLGAGGRRIEIEDAPLTDPARGPSASVVATYPGYFELTNVPILAGRDFEQADGSAGHQVAIVTKEFAERYWHNRTVLGKRFRFYTNDKPGEWVVVAGVSADVVQNPNDSKSDALLYLPYRQEGYDSMALLLRSSGIPASAVRAAVQAMDQDMPLSEVRMLTAAMERNSWFLRVFGVLFLTFGVMALVMAAVGIYAVMAQATTRRTQEIGVRMALGASSRNIMGMVLTRGMKQLMAGLVLGVGAAIPAARAMATLPFRLSPSDPMLLVVVSVVLVAVGIFACWLPARRAAGLNPVAAIRYE